MVEQTRTAYPTLAKSYGQQVLVNEFTPTVEEQGWINQRARTPSLRLGIAVLLKVFQTLHYFPDLQQVPPEIIQHIRRMLGYGDRITIDYSGGPTMYRHMQAVRDYLGVTAFYGSAADKRLLELATRAAERVDEPRDIANAVIEGLVSGNYELPAFHTLDLVTAQAHSAVLNKLYSLVLERIGADLSINLDELLQTNFENRLSSFNSLKLSARRLTRQNMEILADHLAWLESMGDLRTVLASLLDAKIDHFAALARSYDASDVRSFSPAKRYTLIVCLIYRMLTRTRDQLAEMLVRMVALINKKAKSDHEAQQVQQSEQVGLVAANLAGVIRILHEELDDTIAGSKIRRYVEEGADAKRLTEILRQLLEQQASNYLPKLWPRFRTYRAVLFRMLDLLQLVNTSQEPRLLSLMVAIDYIKLWQHRKVDVFVDELDLSFTNDRWRRLIRESKSKPVRYYRRPMEVCVFIHLAEALESGDIAVEGANEYADYRAKLVPWSECEALLPEYCNRMELPSTAKEFVGHLKSLLTTAADAADEFDPHHEIDFGISKDGNVYVKKAIAIEIPESAIALKAEIERSIPERHVLGAMANIESWHPFTQAFGPISGQESRIKDDAERYLATAFALGSNLGAAQAARHMKGRITAHHITYVNQRHITVEKLDRVLRSLNELYLQLPLPRYWGDGTKVGADGTQMDMYEQNLLAGFHFRYRTIGAVAYRHVADNYIAHFRHFAPPGIWEAIMVIEGLMQAKLSVEPRTVHSDTQGQSATVYAFTFLRGIALMARIRNWKDLIFYRPEPGKRYKSIDKLFRGDADWRAIEDNWQELMQIAISIDQAKLSSSVLLRRLGSDSPRSRLLTAAQALGNVVRSIYLLSWITSRQLRQEVTAGTNKVESYNRLSKWVSFGGDVLPVNDPIEQQKRLRYNDLICTCLILQNTADMMNFFERRKESGAPVDESDIPFLSPHITANIKRFGEYDIRVQSSEPWIRSREYVDWATAAKKARPGSAIRQMTTE